MAKGRKTGRRGKGVPNRATADVRATIALIAERNITSVETWLAEIEDPSVRMNCFLRMLEYHVPKLLRTELSGAGGKALTVQIIDPTRRGHRTAP